MPTQINALAFLLVVTFCAYFLVRRCFPASGFDQDLEEYRAVWMDIAIVSVILFIASNIVILYVLLGTFAVVRGWMKAKDDADIFRTFFVLMLVSPDVYIYPDLGGVIRLIKIDPARLGSLVLLLPLLFRTSKATDGNQTNFQSLKSLDIAIFLFPLVVMAFTAQRYSGTHVVRVGLEQVLDIIIPYFAISRKLTDPQRIRSLLRTIAICCLFAACVSIFESLKGYKLYSILQSVYDTPWQLSAMLYRGDFLRAQAIMPNSVDLAVFLEFGLAVYFMALKPSKVTWPWLGCGLFVAAFLASGTRGPLGSAVIAAMLVVVGLKASPQSFGKTVTTVWLLAVGTLVFGWLNFFADLLAGLMQGESAWSNTGTLDYRRELYNTSIALIQQSPFFGVPNYGFQMQHLIQGEGIIDMVNTYIHKTLDYGLFGLTLFMAPYVVALRLIIKALTVGNQEFRFLLIGAAAGLTGVLLALMTTSMGFLAPQALTILCAFGAVIYRIQPHKAGEDRAARESLLARSNTL